MMIGVPLDGGITLIFDCSRDLVKMIMRLLLVAAAVATVQGGHGQSFDHHAHHGDLSMRFKDAGPLRFSECTTSMPTVGPIRIENLCADLELHDCGSNITFGIRFASQRVGTSYLFQQAIDMSGKEVCGSSIAGTPISSICGDSAKVCLTFLDINNVDTLKIGPGYASGCPTLTIKECRLPITGSVVSYTLPLECFSRGADCMLHSSCDKCIEAGCGWCSAGYRKEFSCMPGDKYGPVCDMCGQGQGCDWNYGVCPVDEEELKQREKELNSTRDALSARTKELQDLKDQVSRGGQIVVDQKEFECGTFGAADQAAAGAAVVATVASILCLLGGCFFGGVMGKMGYVDRLLQFSRLREEEGRLADSGPASSYVPPDL